MVNCTVQPIGSRVSKWGEGPIWWDQHLLYVDIKGHKIVRLNPETGEETCWDVGEEVGTVVPRRSGGLVYAGAQGIFTFDPETREKHQIADPEPEKRPNNRFNDGKCDPEGRFWAGTISTVKKEGDASLYMLGTDGTIKKMIDHVTNSNGLCWTADGRTLFYIDTPTREVAGFDFDPASGAISNRRVVVDTAASGFASSPDGMTIDADGRIWVAFCHGGCVACFNPSNGKILQRVDLHCIETTACAFGGANLDRLFVTTGITSDMDEPDAGRVFVIDGLGIQGVPTVAYDG